MCLKYCKSDLSLAEPDPYAGGEGLVNCYIIYIELYRRLVHGGTNQSAALMHYVISCVGVSALHAKLSMSISTILYYCTLYE